MPEIRLCSPRFDRQSAADTDENDEQVCFDVRTADDGQGHEAEDAQQQPIHVAPPFAMPVYIFKVLFCQWPPDVYDQEDGNKEPAEQNTAIAGPEFGNGCAELCHGRIIAVET